MVMEECDMSAGDASVESDLMPDWHRRKANDIDRIDWQPIAELGQTRDPTPRAAHTEET
jgi:hypothetical protein